MRDSFTEKAKSAAAGLGRSGSRRTCCGRFNARDPYAQRRIGDLEHVFAALCDHAHIRCHTGQQAPARIGKTNHSHVGHDVGNVLSRLANLPHLAFKSLTGERIDCETGALSGADAADIRFVDAGIHLHIRQILGNHKELGRLQAGCDRLPLFNRALDHDAIDWGGDFGALQVNPCLCQCRFSLSDVGLRRFDLRLRHSQLRLRRFQALARRVDQSAGFVRLALRNKLLFGEIFLALKIALRLLHIHLHARNRSIRSEHVGLRRQDLRSRRIHIGHRLPNAKFKRLGVNLGNQLPRLDL